MHKTSLTEKFAMIGEHWRPKVVAELNGQELKLVKIKGEFPWHHHDIDEMFLVWRGRFRLETKEGGFLPPPPGGGPPRGGERGGQFFPAAPPGGANPGNWGGGFFPPPGGGR